MLLWIILTLMCCVAAVAAAVPLVRRYEQAETTAEAGLRIFRDQLKEVDRDLAQGAIAAPEADAARLEIQRRMLAATRARETASGIAPGWRTAALVMVTALVAGGGTWLYAIEGRPDLSGVSAGGGAVAALVPPAEMTPPAGAGTVDTMISGLAARLKDRPDDAEGWRMLGWSYFNTQRYEQSAQAYARALALVPASDDYRSSYGEALVQAAGGMVTPEAAKLFETTLQHDAKEPRARFYMALAREQAGDQPRALDLWLSLLADAPADAGWTEDVRQHIAALGKATGRDVSAALGASPAAAAAPVAQSDAVSAMVAQLQAKLAANPKDRDGWAMLIRSLQVRGDMQGARQALAAAQQAFRDDAATASQLTLMAQDLGVQGAQQDGGEAAALQAMPEPDQQAMIRGMVEGLAQRLAAAPHDAEGWIKLMRARQVLNEPDLAREALTKAQAEFAGDAAALTAIGAAARDLGIAAN